MTIQVPTQVTVQEMVQVIAQLLAQVTMWAMMPVLPQMPVRVLVALQVLWVAQPSVAAGDASRKALAVQAPVPERMQQALV